MNRSEFTKIVGFLKASYQNDKLFATDDVMTVWYEQLKDLAYEEVAVVVRKWVPNNRWCPTIADIRAGIVEAKKTETDDWSRGWREMKTAIRKFGYMQERLALNSLDPITREATRRLGWKEICESDTDQEQVLRANFRMIYEQVAKNHNENAALPESVRNDIKELQERLNRALELGEPKDDDEEDD